MDQKDRPRLTEGSAYGGCGAKLAKGELSAILCGLPRAESEDLLVGIDWADDAGVVRIDDHTAIVHTADFFPPIVDDPWAFGRIAAANALSDVYAMGGRPLAGMNLVSFPVGRYDKAVLKEILRGGLEALREAGAVLAGGHTLDGQDLLYGMAVTGVVSPDRLWTNGGARPGDLLVLTKPLGTALITTAAKAGDVRRADLRIATEWMAKLNEAAAQALHGLEPHAVTDVTGFGLAGHSAELAAASSLAVELWADALPPLPGAIQAAERGHTSAGTRKNRESLSDLLRVQRGVPGWAVDLALDPQTSGGLLVACSPPHVQALVRRVPGATIVGRCLAGPEGEVTLVEDGPDRVRRPLPTPIA